MDAWYFLLPLTAATGNLALILENFSRPHRLNRLLILVYILVAGVNLSAVFMLQADSADGAMSALFVLRHFLFFLPPALLALASVLSGRPVFSAAVTGLVTACTGFIIAADITYFTGSRVLVREMLRHSWGWFPHLEPRALAALGLLFGASLLAGLYWILRPRGRSVFEPRTTALFYAGWLIGAGLNSFALAGMNVFPLGNGVDALVSLVFSAHLHRERAGFPGPASRVSRVLACASAGLLAGFFVLSFLPDSRYLPLFAGGGIAAGAVFFLQMLAREKEPPAGELAKALEPFGLSKQETRICELVAQGYSKQDILVFLNIADGTLRNHLIKIYEKTIHKTTRVPEEARDKLQRLTVFLHKLTYPA